jgi:hypothetical protein
MPYHNLTLRESELKKQHHLNEVGSRIILYALSPMAKIETSIEQKSVCTAQSMHLGKWIGFKTFCRARNLI